MMLVNMTTMLGIVLLAMLLPSDAFHIAWHAGAKVGSPTTSCTFSTPRNEVSVRVPHYRFAVVGDKEESGPNLRDKLRKATGFSLTAFRSTWRAATGISLSAIYASALAASGLWIRKVMSAVLSVFPAWFRYFLQPILVLYYAPLFILRGLTGPTRKQAKKKHELLVDGWVEAVEFAETTKKDGYWPVHVTEDGEFELQKPPNPNEKQSEQFANAVAESVEQAMEQKSDSKGN